MTNSRDDYNAAAERAREKQATAEAKASQLGDAIAERDAKTGHTLGVALGKFDPTPDDYKTN